MPADDRTRPGWWPRWYPIRCGNGHPLLPGTIRAPWVHCDCPGAGEARGHEVLHCVEHGCHWKMWPPEHTGEQSPEPRRV